MLVRDAGEARDENDREQADEADFRRLRHEREHQDHSDERLNYQRTPFPRTVFRALRRIELHEHLPHGRRQRLAIAKPTQSMQHANDDQPDDDQRQHDRRHRREKLREIPSRVLGNEQILRLADGCKRTADGRSNSRRHHEPAQEAAK